MLSSHMRQHSRNFRKIPPSLACQSKNFIRCPTRKETWAPQLASPSNNAYVHLSYILDSQLHTSHLELVAAQIGMRTEFSAARCIPIAPPSFAFCRWNWGLVFDLRPRETEGNAPQPSKSCNELYVGRVDEHVG